MFFPVVKTFNIYQDNFIFVLFTTLFLFYGLQSKVNVFTTTPKERK
jgi:hypothetical protein